MDSKRKKLMVQGNVFPDSSYDKLESKKQHDDKENYNSQLSAKLQFITPLMSKPAMIKWFNRAYK